MFIIAQLFAVEPFILKKKQPSILEASGNYSFPVLGLVFIFLYQHSGLLQYLICSLLLESLKVHLRTIQSNFKRSKTSV